MTRALALALWRQRTQPVTASTAGTRTARQASGRPEPGKAVACLIEQHSSGRDNAAALAYFHSASAR
ncbi:MAG: hypothetical protein J0L85_09320 [Zoogloea sp.]|nr:hypothetical protein [Zoogloea sp.]MCA0188559.1 hypothetical protein [Pseudomonadota bacterium]